MNFTDALAKAQKYCAYQERSYFNIKQKLLQWGIVGNETNLIIEKLEKENYLSEQRFANLYVSSKVHQNKWGKNKVRVGLLQHEVSQNIINWALDKIDMVEYKNNLRHLTKKKEKELREDNSEKRFMKLKNFLYSKGYETEIINEINFLI